MKRVLCLYRVSTKGQVDPKDDIPVQRRECMAFIERQKDWVYLGERLEKGVSGYKVSVNKRDVLMEIKGMAERHEFEVLLVFMFDRLGRREDETPFLVEFFIKQGIEVWSVNEGRQNIESRGDKLMNYLRFWMAGGESEKTSLRVKAAQTQMTEDGIWRGGTRPYGYKLVHKGRIGKKNRQLYDLEIDEFEGPIIQEIFTLVTVDGWGTLRTANYLNSKYPNPLKVWTAQTIRSILRNPIYTGRMHMNDVVSEPIESLRLVSDETMAFAQHCVTKRIQSRYPLVRQEENENLPVNARTKVSVYGATMLSGLLYCAHCGHKLVGSYCQENRNGVMRHRPIYRDYYGAVKAKNCIGQTTYSARRIEATVLEIVRSYLQSMKGCIDAAWEERTRQKLRTASNAKLKAAKEKLHELEKRQLLLKAEVVKSMQGESAFSKDMLQTMIDETVAAMATAEEEVRNSENDTANERAQLKQLKAKYQEIIDWADAFEHLQGDSQKMVLARIIERVTVDRNYNLSITFYITREEFEGKVEKMESVSILQADAAPALEFLPQESKGA